MLNKDTTLCISLAGRPSNIGTRFHNYLYDELGLNFAYKAFTTGDLDGAIRGVRALGIRGCSVSMPFKEAVIPLADAGPTRTWTSPTGRGSALLTAPGWMIRVLRISHTRWCDQGQR